MLKIKSKFHKLLFLFALITIFSIAALIQQNEFIDRELDHPANKESVLIFGTDTDQEYRPFRVATSSGPHTLEIVDSWDSSSNIVLEQVVETLFAINLTIFLDKCINII